MMQLVLYITCVFHISSGIYLLELCLDIPIPWLEILQIAVCLRQRSRWRLHPNCGCTEPLLGTVCMCVKGSFISECFLKFITFVISSTRICCILHISFFSSWLGQPVPPDFIVAYFSQPNSSLKRFHGKMTCCNCIEPTFILKDMSSWTKLHADILIPKFEIMIGVLM